MAITAPPVDRFVDRYREMTAKSRAYHERAAKALTGGTTRARTYFDPYPPCVAYGEGQEIVDIDGNRRIDFLNNYTSLILVHAHPAVVEAVSRTMGQGSAFAAPAEHEL